MKIIFMGTPEFSIPCLEALINHEHEVIAVVTQPDKPKGRGKKVQPTPIKEVALKNNIPVYQPLKVKDPEFTTFLRSLSPDLIVVVAFGQILSKDILDIPPNGCVNVHASLLPKYRGAGPIYWSVINGEEKTGVTTMFMDVGLDTGDMILKEEIPILEQDTAGTIHDKLSSLGARVLINTIKLIEQGKAPREKQKDEEATYAPMLDKKLGKIDWGKSSKEVVCLIRGTNPWPVAYTSYQGQKFKIYEAELFDKEYKGRQQGEIVEIVPKEGLVISTGDGSVIINDVQFDGSKRMSMDEYLRGHNITLGIILE